ncbi:TPA: hypothetical protein DCQ44_02065 [Candidatus Taylorbacteria bacterium]|nr:hypothetical protein [Candidatus Taylorbacteria bacterium]
MNIKSKTIAGLILIAAFVTTIAVIVLLNPNVSVAPTQTATTTSPVATSTATSTSAPAPKANLLLGTIIGTVKLGPTCPVMRIPPDPACADKPYQTRLILTSSDGSRTITNFSSDTRGEFKIKVLPGDYLIRSDNSQSMLPRCSVNGTITVKANKETETTVYCDTGIR